MFLCTFVFTVLHKNNKIVELLSWLLWIIKKIFPQSARLIPMVIFGRFRIHCITLITRKSLQFYFDIPSPIPVLNPGSQTSSWEPHNQLPIWDPVVSSQTLLTARIFLPSPQASRGDTDRALRRREGSLRLRFYAICQLCCLIQTLRLIHIPGKGSTAFQANSLRTRIYYP